MRRILSMKAIFWRSALRLGRPLKKKRTLPEASGKMWMYVCTVRGKDQKEFTGRLNSYDDGTVTLDMEDGSQMVFERGDIALIRLSFDF